MNISDYANLRTQAGMKALSTFLATTAEGGKAGTKYKFRAECSRDAKLFFAAISEFVCSGGENSPLDFGDVEGTFVLSRDISSRDLLWAASRIVDGHVVVQTLELEANYTGERDYGRFLDVSDPATVPCVTIRRPMRRGAKAYVEEL